MTDLTLVSSKGPGSNYNGRRPNLAGGHGSTEGFTESIPTWALTLIILIIIITAILCCICILCSYETDKDETNEKANSITMNVDELRNRYPNLTPQENYDIQQPRTHNMNIPYRVAMMNNDESNSVQSHNSIIEYGSVKIPRCTIHL